MTSLRTFSIQFDRPVAAYQPGETVTGKIIVDAARNKSVRGLYFIVKGVANVYWTESSSTTDFDGKSTTTTDTYSANEHYFTLSADALGTRESHSTAEITEGYHEFLFKFDIPCNIPSSFEHTYGHVRYTIKAVINRPWKFDHECKAAFTVNSILDLNAHRGNCIGISDEARKSFSCCCCSLGSTSLTIQVPSSGYVPGQIINTLVGFENANSEVRIHKISTTLQRVLRFHATSKTRTDNFEITSSSYSGPFNTQGQANLEIRVPPIPPSNLLFCKIIDLDYNLKVVIRFVGPHLNVTKSYPLLIGSVPLYITPSGPSIPQSTTKEPVQSMPMPQPSTSNAQAPPIGFVVPDQADISTNWGIPPPSYEECVSGAHHIKDYDESDYVKGANTPFSPMYPVFNYPAQSALTN
ncbi:arrestin domain-containing protein 2-like isoform X2 [Lasioglossum baleicum]|uniref:arrestin domain-containing protein 2-like isoform X2 n=1 Tax=Lasioglossum baleicum TaxID=434251 RepID=UPI003FCC367A